MVLPLEKTFMAHEYLGLSVEKPAIPDFVRDIASRNNLYEKSEIHISVVVTKNAHLLWRAVGERSDMVATIESLFTSFAWGYVLTEEYFLHERNYSRKDLIENGHADDIPEHTRRSIVQKVQLPDISSFYAKVNELLSIELATPVPHITLFTWSDYEPYKLRGIGINSAEEFERFTIQRLNT